MDMSIALALTIALLTGNLGNFVRDNIIFHQGTKPISKEAVGIPQAETITLEPERGVKLVGWYAAPKNASRPLVLYFHGRDGFRPDHFRKLTDLDYGLLAFAYRGYHESTGSPTEANVMRDAAVAYAKAEELGYKPHRIVLMGESLGSGIATKLAADHEAAALVLDSPYDSFPLIAWSLYKIPTYVYESLVEDKFHADEAIEKVRAPVLMSVGCKDDLILPERGFALYDRAKQPKKMIASAGARHVPFAEHDDVLTQAMAWVDAPIPSDVTPKCS